MLDPITRNHIYLKISLNTGDIERHEDKERNVTYKTKDNSLLIQVSFDINNYPSFYLKYISNGKEYISTTKEQSVYDKKFISQMFAKMSNNYIENQLYKRR